jgi:signal transduction histidine kinase
MSRQEKSVWMNGWVLLCVTVLWVGWSESLLAQSSNDSTVVSLLPTGEQPDRLIPILSDSMLSDTGVILLSSLPGWVYSPYDSTQFKDSDYNDSDWQMMNPAELSLDEHINFNGYLKGWFRFRFQLDSTLTRQALFLRIGTWGATEIYVDGELEASFGRVSDSNTPFENYMPLNILPDEFKTQLVPGKTYTMAVRFEDRDAPWLFQYLGISYRVDPWVRITTNTYTKYIQELVNFNAIFNYSITTALLVIFILIIAIYLPNRSDFVLRDSAIFVFLFLISMLFNGFDYVFGSNLIVYVLIQNLSFTAVHMVFGWIPLFLNGILFGSRPSWMRWVFLLAIPAAIISTLLNTMIISFSFLGAVTLLSIWTLIRGRDRIKGENSIILASVIGELILIVSFIGLEPYYTANPLALYNQLHIFIIYLFFPLLLIIYLAVRYTHNFKLLQDKYREVSRLSEEKLSAEREKQKLITMQKQVLEKEVEIRTADLQQSLANLQAAQQQLVQQEKLASLGQLTAGIAHEIKNPLNFVNNFSSVSIELLDEALVEVEKLQKDNITEEIRDILSDVKSNLTKIHDHGTRADRIVKSMLLHSRGGSGTLEPADLNAIVNEYANLAYHGMRAAKNPLDVDLQIELDPTINHIPLITEDFARVILNLCNNGFDAMRDLRGGVPAAHENPNQRSTPRKPKLVVRTRTEGRYIFVEVEDNGSGIPLDIQDKIMEPFFTTKKGTDGTGLGLSITHDIIKAHGGELTLESVPGRTVFTIQLNA